MEIARAMILILVVIISVAGAADTALHPLSDDFIHHINSKQASWKAGRNFPQDTPLRHMRRLLGVHPNYNVDSLSLLSVKHDANLIAQLPDSFDPREKWPNCHSLSEIRDQGSCGSCWAFGAVEVMTDRVCTYSNGTSQFHFSAEDLVSCCGIYCDCQGGNPIFAWKYWVKHGIVSGGNYNSSQGCKSYSFPPCEQHASGYQGNVGDKKPCLSYDDARTPKCLKKCDDNKLVYKKDKRYGEFIYTTEGENMIKAELFLNGPVEAVFDVYSDFFSYKSGVYRYVEGDLVYGHAIKILGWGVEDGNKYWLAANSWNEDWGDRGFFKILRGENHLGIESNIIAGEPLLTNVL